MIIKPCPFCSGTDIKFSTQCVGNGEYLHALCCYTCPACVNGDDKDDAIEKWNRREMYCNWEIEKK